MFLVFSKHARGMTLCVCDLFLGSKGSACSCSRVFSRCQMIGHCLSVLETFFTGLLDFDDFFRKNHHSQRRPLAPQS